MCQSNTLYCDIGVYMFCPSHKDYAIPSAFTLPVGIFLRTRISTLSSFLFFKWIFSIDCNVFLNACIYVLQALWCTPSLPLMLRMTSWFLSLIPVATRKGQPLLRRMVNSATHLVPTAMEPSLCKSPVRVCWKAPLLFDFCL